MALNLECIRCRTRNPEVSRSCRVCGTRLPPQNAGIWWVDYPDADGRRIVRRIGAYLDARTIENQIRQARRDGVVWRAAHSRATLGELRDGFLAEPTIRAMKSYVKMGNSLRLIVADLGEARNAMTLSTQAVHEYQQGRLRAGITGSTINREVSALNIMLTWFSKPGKIIARNPISGYEALAENPARNRTVTEEEYQRLGQALSGDWRPVFEVLHWLPLRFEEALTLSWSDRAGPWLDTSRARWVVQIPVGASKSGRARVVPLYYPELQARLAALPSRFAHERVFTTPAGKPLTASRLRRPWDAGRQAAGCPDLRVHDLKHTAVTWLLWFGVPAIEVGHASDHATLAMQRVYANMTAEWMTRQRDRSYNAATGLIEKIGAGQSSAIRV